MKVAMILAAGLGTRLLPYTKTKPKCLYPLAGTPLIDYHLAKLGLCGFKRVVINIAHHGDQVRAHCGEGHRYGLEIKYSVEDPRSLLGTGGAVKAARSLFLGVQHVLVISADIYCELNYASLDPQYLSCQQAQLLVVGKPSWADCADFGLSSEDQRLYPVGFKYSKPVVFAGLGWFPVSAWDSVAENRFGLGVVCDILLKKMNILGFLYEGLWQNVGSLARSQEIELVLRKQQFATASI